MRTRTVTMIARVRLINYSGVGWLTACSQGEHLLHVLNTLGSRKVVLEAELREIEEDIVANATMCRKYGEEFFTEGTTRLAQTRAEKQQKLAEIKQRISILRLHGCSR